MIERERDRERDRGRRVKGDMRKRERCTLELCVRERESVCVCLNSMKHFLLSRALERLLNTPALATQLLWHSTLRFKETKDSERVHFRFSLSIFLWNIKSAKGPQFIWKNILSWSVLKCEQRNWKCFIKITEQQFVLHLFAWVEKEENRSSFSVKQNFHFQSQKFDFQQG